MVLYLKINYFDNKKAPPKTVLQMENPTTQKVGERVLLSLSRFCPKNLCHCVFCIDCNVVFIIALFLCQGQNR